MISKYTLGLNFLHSDSSACIFRDNKLLAASEEERFTRVKHSAKFPINSIKFCLNEANIDISKINLVTINSDPFSSIDKKLMFLLKNPASIKIVLFSLKNSRQKINLAKTLSDLDKKKNFKGKIKFVDHHESHIASSLFFSNFSKCANLSIDGFGDFASCG